MPRGKIDLSLNVKTSRLKDVWTKLNQYSHFHLLERVDEWVKIEII